MDFKIFDLYIDLTLKFKIFNHKTWKDTLTSTYVQVMNNIFLDFLDFKVSKDLGKSVWESASVGDHHYSYSYLYLYHIHLYVVWWYDDKINNKILIEKCTKDWYYYKV